MRWRINVAIPIYMTPITLNTTTGEMAGIFKYFKTCLPGFHRGMVQVPRMLFNLGMMHDSGMNRIAYADRMERPSRRYSQNVNTIIGTSNFEILSNHKFYMDKTPFLKTFFNSPPVICITAPRRFGKSALIDMVQRFTQVENEMNSINKGRDLFSNKLISHDKIFKDEHYRKYPVIRVSFVSVKGRTIDEILRRFKRLLIKTYKGHQYLETSEKLSLSDIKDFIAVRDGEGQMDQEFLEGGLASLARMLSIHWSKKSIVLIDEFDVPVSHAIFSNIDATGLQDIFNFLQTVFVNLLKDSDDHVCKGLLTGCQYLGGVFSPLANNIVHYPFLHKKFSTYLGFTEEDISVGILPSTNVSDEEKQKIKEWYNGYAARDINGNDIKIYCPWSILHYLDEKEFRRYWAEGGLDHVVNILSIKEIRSRLVQLLIGSNSLLNSISIDHRRTMGINEAKILIKLSNQTHHTRKINEDMINLFFQYLYELGYLSKAHDLTQGMIELKIPNNEVMELLRKKLHVSDLLKKFTAEKCVEDFVNIFKDIQNPDNLKRLPNAARAVISCYKEKKFLVKKELDAHNIIFEVLAHSFEGIENEGRTPAGKKPDIITKKMGIVIEVKFGKKESSETAFKQIIDKNYASCLDLNRDIILLGLHFDESWKKCSLAYLIVKKWDPIAKKLNQKSIIDLAKTIESD